MSTLEPKTPAKLTLSHFKSTNHIQTRTRRHSNSKPLKSNLSGFLSGIDSSNKALLQTNLPDINSKKSSQKRSSYLEMWLDEALDPQQKQASTESPPLRIEVDKTGPLKTVQKFQIDKKYLKSQNISLEAIDKIYSSLYVYTYGINHTFYEILSLTKVNQHVEKKIVGNFWNTFIRLLEGCTSFQTTFQIIEEGLIKTQTELKDTFLRRQQEWLQEKATLQTQNLKLMKKINQQSFTLTKLANDYNISETTLQLTDQAFNQEVNIRLKFQEKVNEMFNSYDQLRSKYQYLLEQFRFNQTVTEEMKKQEVIRNQQMDELKIKLDQANIKIARAQETIQQRNNELGLRRQQIFQLSRDKIKLVEQKEENEEEVRKIIKKVSYYKQQSEQLRAESLSKSIISSQLQKRIKEQQKQMEYCRQIIEKLYEQLNENGTTIASLQEKLIKISLQHKQAQGQRDISKSLALQYQISNAELSTTLEGLQKDLELAQGQITLKNSLLEKNAVLLANLQAVNGKFQTLYKFTSSEKQKLDEQMQKAIDISQRFKQEMDGMKMLLQSKVVQLGEAQSKLQNERQVFRAKIAGLKEEVEIKEQKVLQMHNLHIEESQKATQANNNAEELKSQNEKMRNLILNLETEILQFTIKFEALMNQRTQQGNNYKDLEEQLQSMEQKSKRFSDMLTLKQKIISSTNERFKSQNYQLRSMLEFYRQNREKKVSYVHPMQYEDALHQIKRLYQKKIDFQAKLSENTLAIDRLNNEIIRLEQQKAKYKQETDIKIQLLMEAATKSEQKIVSLKLVVKSLEDRLLQSDTKYQSKSKSFQQKLILLQNEKRDLLSKMNFMTKDTTQIRKQLNSRNHQMNDLVKDKENQQKIITKLRLQLQHLNWRANQNQLNIQRLKTPRQPSRESAQQNQLQNCKEQFENKKQKPQIVMISKEAQTDKKFTHASKFQVVQTGISVGCQANQVDFQQSGIQEEPKVERRGGERQRSVKKVDTNQFKKALKITYMRR